MGVDGDQTLQIRGPEDMLQEMEASGFVIDGDDEIKHIATRFFGNQVTIKHRSPRFIVIRYEYRNIPVYQYLEALLKAYPKCWMKNEFSTDQGLCGVWIARMVHGKVSIQDHSWAEVHYEEIIHCEDFSISE